VGAQEKALPRKIPTVRRVLDRKATGGEKEGRRKSWSRREGRGCCFKEEKIREKKGGKKVSVAPAME